MKSLAEALVGKNQIIYFDGEKLRYLDFGEVSKFVCLDRKVLLKFIAVLGRVLRDIRG